MGILNVILKILESHTGNKLSLNPICLKVNIDGVPSFKSSSKQFMPILGAFGGMKPFIISLYCGMQKRDPVSEFQNDFLLEFQDLKANGFKFDNLLFEMGLKYFCCDAPARQMLKCVKAHNGYDSCERCTIHGTYVKNRVVFEEQECPLRNDMDF
ncbi:uncharacterized protein LOC136091713 [Hydra vulgaris]|uniref:Uncharacterized protein LOC136091713 n=1 Tax=Hydra vulgaris TaxID=6087 RepID=A0ABM4DLS1_HYDVU